MREYEDNSPVLDSEKIEAARNRELRVKRGWSEQFPKSLSYPDGARLEDVEALDHFQMFSLAQRLKELRTVDVTTEILKSVIEGEPTLPS